MRKTPEICPNCGAEVPHNAIACPECGADHKTGWSELAEAQRLDLPDDEFDYDKFIQEEFADKKTADKQYLKPIWTLVALALLLLIIITFLSKILK